MPPEGEELEVKDDKGKDAPKDVNLEELGGLDLDVNLKEEVSEEKVEDKVEVKDEKAVPKEETKKEPELDNRFKEMESRMSRLEADKRDLQKALHEARQDKKRVKEAEGELSYEELTKIVEEHKDDPKVLLNAAAYYAKNLIRNTKKEAVNEVEINNKKAELDKVLRNRIKDYDDENGQSRQLINTARTAFNLDDHPFSDFLSTAAALYTNWESVRDSIFEEGKKKALEEQAEANRKKGIDNTKPLAGGSKPIAGNGQDRELSATELETAKRLGFTTPAKLKLYRSQILRNVAPAK